MSNTSQPTSASKGAIWMGRVISAPVSFFMLFDGAIKVLKLPAVVQGTVQLGFPEATIVPIGLVVVLCVAVYLIPRTSILGAILLTGYLGGATATQVRLESLWFLFPVFIGVLAWAGLYLRDERLRLLVPLRSSERF